MKDALMPSGNFTVCPAPLRFDAYEGCTAGCRYCFARVAALSGITSKHDQWEAVQKRKMNLGKSCLGEGRSAIAAYRALNIPVHIGGMADSLQPIEQEEKYFLQGLEWFADNSVPVILSTKFSLLGKEPWRSAWERIPQRLLQVSCIAADDRMLQLEPGAAPWQERMALVRDLSQTCPAIIRAQPFILSFGLDGFSHLAEQAAAHGASGITVEGLKLPIRKHDFMDRALQAILGKAYQPPQERGSSDWEYTYSQRFAYQLTARKACRANGLAHWAADNAFRWLGDSPNCCGQDLIDCGVWEANWGHAAVEALLHGEVDFSWLSACIGAQAGGTHAYVNAGNGVARRLWAERSPADQNCSNFNVNTGNGAQRRAWASPKAADIHAGNFGPNTGNGPKARQWASESGQTLHAWYRWTWNKTRSGNGPQAIMPNLVAVRQDAEGNAVYRFVLPPGMRDAIYRATGEELTGGFNTIAEALDHA